MKSLFRVSALILVAGASIASMTMDASARKRSPIYEGHNSCVNWCNSNRHGAEHDKCICNCVNYYGKPKPPECRPARRQ